MLFFKFFAVGFTQSHYRLHIHFIESGKHRRTILASSKRSAIRLRKRVIGTRFSERAL